MRPSSDLAKLHSAVLTRITRLRGRFADAHGKVGPERSLLLGACIIELDNVVLAGLRQFTISTLKGTRTVTKAKAVSNLNLRKEQEAAAYMLSVLNSVKFNKLNQPATVSRKDEPTVRDPKDTEKVLIAAGATNIGSLQTALSLNSTMFGDIGPVRNFYAHRNADTWRKAQLVANRLSLQVRHADDLISVPVGTGPATVVDNWLFDAEIFFDELMQ